MARNVAHNLVKLNVPINLIGAVGNDSFGEIILNEMNNLDIETDHIKISKHFQTGVYLAILNEIRDMYVSISDMQIMEEIDTVFLEEKKRLYNWFKDNISRYKFECRCNKFCAKISWK